MSWLVANGNLASDRETTAGAHRLVGGVPGEIGGNSRLGKIIVAKLVCLVILAAWREVTERRGGKAAVPRRTSSCGSTANSQALVRKWAVKITS